MHSLRSEEKREQMEKDEQACAFVHWYWDSAIFKKAFGRPHCHHRTSQTLEERIAREEERRRREAEEARALRGQAGCLSVKDSKLFLFVL